jgi:hypothetical protein
MVSAEKIAQFGREIVIFDDRFFSPFAEDIPGSRDFCVKHQPLQTVKLRQLRNVCSCSGHE